MNGQVDPEAKADVPVRQQRHLVITIHGIRTFGQWQERLEMLLREKHPGIEVRHYNYGYFSLIAYFIPIVRWLATLRFRRALLRTIGDEAWDRIDIVAHSFGTSLVSWGLASLPPKQRPKVHTLLLAGSVLRLNFPWPSLLDGCVKRVVNECGSKDFVLVVGQMFVLFSGMAGRVGFQGILGERLRNRFYAFGHSGYFVRGKNADMNTLMRERWVPLLTGEDPVAPVDERSSTSVIGGLMTFLLNNADLVKIAILVLLIWGGGGWAYRLYEKDRMEHASALSRSIAARATSQLEKDPELSLLLSIEAMSRSSTREAKEALRASLLSSHMIVVLRGHEGAIETVEFSPDGQQVVTGSTDRTARIWNVAAGNPGPVLRGHEDRIKSAVFSPDGNRILTASADGTARIWDAHTGDHLTTFKGHTKYVLEASFSFKGDRVVTIGGDKTTRTWDASSGREIALVATEDENVKQAAFDMGGERVVTVLRDGSAHVSSPGSSQTIPLLKSREDVIDSAAISPDGATIRTRGAGGSFSLWDSRTGIKRMQLAGSPPEGMFDPQGHWIFSSQGNGDMQVWNTKTGKVQASMRGHLGKSGLIPVLFGQRFSADGMKIVTSGYDGTARVWESVSGEPIAVLRGHEEAVLEAALSPDGRRVATVGADRTLRIWRCGIQESLIVANPGGESSKVHFSPSGHRLVTSGMEPISRVWDVATGREVGRFEGHRAEVQSAAYSSDGSLVVTTDSKHIARIWNLETTREISVCEGHTGLISAASFSPDGRRMLTGSWDNTARVWESDTGKQIQRFGSGGGLSFATINEALFSPDGETILTSSGGRARLWDARTGKERWELKGSSSTLNSVALSHDGALCVTAGDGGALQVWETRTGRRLADLTGHKSPMVFMDKVVDATFRPDGEHVVSSGWDQTARVWEARTGKQLSAFRGITDRVTGSSYSPDGKWIISTGWDGSARIWEAATGRELVVLRGVYWAAFSSAGDRIYTTDFYGTARVYKPEILAPPEDLLRLARKQVTRELTPAEIAKYLAEDP